MSFIILTKEGVDLRMSFNRVTEEGIDPFRVVPGASVSEWT